MSRIKTSFENFQEFLLTKIALIRFALFLIYLIFFGGIVYYQFVFSKAIPLFFILNFVLILIFQTHRTKQFIRFCLVIFLFGYGIELLGTTTGNIFGHYDFGNGLGAKLKGVPVLMGLVWLTLTYCSAQIVNATVKGDFILLKAIVGSFFMVMIDIFIEMIATRYDFWHWDGGIVPFQNFVAWLIIGFFFNLLYQTINLTSKNKIASTVFVLQLLLFFGLSFKESYKKIQPPKKNYSAPKFARKAFTKKSK